MTLCMMLYSRCKTYMHASDELLNEALYLLIFCSLCCLSFGHPYPPKGIASLYEPTRAHGSSFTHLKLPDQWGCTEPRRSFSELNYFLCAMLRMRGRGGDGWQDRLVKEKNGRVLFQICFIGVWVGQFLMFSCRNLITRMKSDKPVY